MSFSMLVPFRSLRPEILDFPFNVAFLRVVALPLRRPERLLNVYGPTFWFFDFSFEARAKHLPLPPLPLFLKNSINCIDPKLPGRRFLLGSFLLASIEVLFGQSCF